VSLELEDVERKLVRERRGGYCFEQNLLLKAALEQALGVEVQPLLARVRFGRPAGAVSPRTHLILRVRDDDGIWHADVGFGRGTLLVPIPFGPGGEYEQQGWRYRVAEQEQELVLQTLSADGWTDLYEFSPRPVPRVDIETSNWFTTSHPRSPFVTGFVACRHDRDGSRLMLSDWEGLSLTRQTPYEQSVTPLGWDEVAQLLEREFGLDGFTPRAAVSPRDG
jgi:N-hydroxyarylamine O-acetyltransferase